MNKIDEEKIYNAMVKGVFVEFCDLAIMYGLPVLETKFGDRDKAKKRIEAVQEVARLKTNNQKKRAKMGLKDINNENEYIKFLTGCFIELDLQLKTQLKRLLDDSDVEEAYDYFDKKLEEEKDLLLKEIRDLNKKEKKDDK